MLVVALLKVSLPVVPVTDELKASEGAPDCGVQGDPVKEVSVIVPVVSAVPVTVPSAFGGSSVTLSVPLRALVDTHVTTLLLVVVVEILTCPAKVPV